MKSVRFFSIALLISLIIFVGLPLLGWGTGKILQFFTNPARLSYVIVIIGFQIFSILYNPQVGQKDNQPKEGVKQHKIDLLLIQVFSLGIVFAAPFSDSHSFLVFNFGDVIRFLGFFLLIPGFIFMQIAEKYLGKQFSIEVTLQNEHALIHDGPYKYLRHPRYLGILTFFAGISVIFRSLLALMLVIGLGLVLIWRIQAEEALMKQEFGEVWDDYREKSWRIIPFIY